MAISNESLSTHRFLASMCGDQHFPPLLVDKCCAILMRLCERIERERPDGTAALCELTHAATDEFNVLADEFDGTETELTTARELIAADFDKIARAYGFDADVEELMAACEWGFRSKA